MCVCVLCASSLKVSSDDSFSSVESVFDQLPQQHCSWKSWKKKLQFVILSALLLWGNHGEHFIHSSPLHLYLLADWSQLKQWQQHNRSHSKKIALVHVQLITLSRPLRWYSSANSDAANPHGTSLSHCQHVSQCGDKSWKHFPKCFQTPALGRPLVKGKEGEERKRQKARGKVAKAKDRQEKEALVGR